jgi:hypothetical protein
MKNEKIKCGKYEVAPEDIYVRQTGDKEIELIVKGLHDLNIDTDGFIPLSMVVVSVGKMLEERRRSMKKYSLTNIGDGIFTKDAKDFEERFGVKIDGEDE